MNVNKATTYTISVDVEEYNALVFMANIMVKILQDFDDDIMYMDLLDIDTFEEKQDILLDVAENIAFSQ